MVIWLLAWGAAALAGAAIEMRVVEIPAAIRNGARSFMRVPPYSTHSLKSLFVGQSRQFDVIEAPLHYALPLARAMLMSATSAISEDILQVRTADVWMAWPPAI